MPDATEQRRLELEMKKRRLAALREQRKVSTGERLFATAPAPGARSTLSTEEVRAILDEVGIPSQVDTRTRRDSDQTISTAETQSEESLAEKTVQVPQVTKLDFSEAATITFEKPSEAISYSKSVQTDEQEASMEESNDASGDIEEPDPSHTLVPNSFASDEEDSDSTVTPNLPPALSEEEKAQIVASEPFSVFFDRAARIIERVVAEDADLCQDYSGKAVGEGVGSDEILDLVRILTDDVWTAARSVVSMDFSMDHQDLLAVAYGGKADGSPAEPGGVVLLWNVKYKKTSPDFVFHSQTTLTSVVFYRFLPDLVVGGTSAGFICVWDMRKGRRLPLIKSETSAYSHWQQVFAMNVVGERSSHTLMTASTDGRLLKWNASDLRAPLNFRPLVISAKIEKSIPVLCMAFPRDELDSFVLGGEDGQVYALSRNPNETGITQFEDWHSGPISGLSFNRTPMFVASLSRLFLSSSFDWTIKLWSLAERKPLLTLDEHSVFVYDVAWSPVHPAVFASIDADGNIFIWNLNVDIEEPIAKKTVESNVRPTKLKWTASGKHIVVGDAKGRVSLYKVHESLCSPSSDEWTKLARTLSETARMKADNQRLAELVGDRKKPSVEISERKAE